jgi:TolA-binding protein
MRKLIEKTSCVLAVSAMILTGCSGPVGDFVTTRYENVVGYFNTYYNAKKAFDEAEVEILKGLPSSPDSNRYAPIAVPQAERTKLALVIEKCSKIIQMYDKSKWVDNALLLIGKSYYYQNEMLPARKKFSELLENFPRSDLRFEAMIGLVKTHYRMEESQALHAAVRELVPQAIEDDEEDIALEALLVEGQSHYDRGDYLEAKKYYTQASAIEGDDALRAMAQYRLGRCLEFLGNQSEAAQAFAVADGLGPPFALRYAARLRLGSTLAAIGSYEKALTVLSDLQGEILTNQERSYVDLEIANVYHLRGQYDAALLAYAEIDSLYPRTNASAKACFQRGIMHEKHFQDFAKARDFYERAAQVFPSSEVAPIGLEKAAIFGRYLSDWRELNILDSLLAARIHALAGPDSVTVHRAAADTSADLPDTLGLVSDSTHRAVNGTRSSEFARTQAQSEIPLDSILAKRASYHFALGVLFLLDLEQADSAEYWLTTMLSEYPRSRLAPRALYALAESHRLKGNTTAVDSLHAELIARYPDSEYALSLSRVRGEEASMTVPDPADSAYALADGLLEKGMPKEAIGKLRDLAVKFPGSPAAAKARYTAGWVYENVLLMNDSAASQYRVLVQDYPTSVYATRVRPKLAVYDNPNAPPEEPPPSPPPAPQKKEEPQAKKSEQAAKRSPEPKPPETLPESDFPSPLPTDEEEGEEPPPEPEDP